MLTSCVFCPSVAEGGRSFDMPYHTRCVANYLVPRVEKIFFVY